LILLSLQRCSIGPTAIDARQRGAEGVASDLAIGVGAALAFASEGIALRGLATRRSPALGTGPRFDSLIKFA